MDAVPLGLLFLAICVMTGIALEAGYRLGRWRYTRSEEEKPATVSAMVASVVGLFAFLLAFTFGMVANRYEARRQAIVDDANVIGTTYLRTSLLPAEQRGRSAELLREYVDIRLDKIRQGKVEEAVARSEEIQTQLWIEATRATETDRGPLMGLYIQSLNQLIDQHTVRVHAGLRSRIPASIWIGLCLLALLSMASVGYQSGLSATRRSPEMLVLILAFAGVMLLIADMDNPTAGFLVARNDSLIDLQSMMRSQRP